MRVGIIGAGPVGLHMACTLAHHNIPYIVIEKGQIGQTILNWPDQTRFHSLPEKISLGNLPVSAAHHERLQKHEYLSYLRQLTVFYKLNIQPYEEVMSVLKTEDGFKLQTRNMHKLTREYILTHTIFATGSAHEAIVPDIPGINLPHVQKSDLAYHRVFNQKVVIIGGRHSALEYAIKAYRTGAKSVVICARSNPFEAENIKKEVLNEITALIESKKIALYPNATVTEIRPDCVRIKDRASSGDLEIPADWAVLACGYRTSFKILEKMGVEVSGPNKTPVFNPNTMETNIRGSYVIGTAVAGNQHSKYEYFIENTLHHTDKVVKHIIQSNDMFFPLQW